MIYRAFRYKIASVGDILSYDYSFGYFEGGLSDVSENACDVLYVALPSMLDGRPEWGVRGGHLDRCIVKVEYVKDSDIEVEQPVGNLITLTEAVRRGIAKIVTNVEDTYGQTFGYRSYGGGDYHVLPTAKPLPWETWIE